MDNLNNLNNLSSELQVGLKEILDFVNKAPMKSTEHRLELLEQMVNDYVTANEDESYKKKEEIKVKNEVNEVN